MVFIEAGLLRRVILIHNTCYLVISLAFEFQDSFIFSKDVLVVGSDPLCYRLVFAYA